MKDYSFIQYRDTMKIPDGVYNARYNREPALIRMKNGIPVWVQFMGFMKDVDGVEEVRSSSIFKPNGILHSSVELLLPAQKLAINNY